MGASDVSKVKKFEIGSYQAEKILFIHVRTGSTQNTKSGLKNTVSQS